MPQIELLEPHTHAGKPYPAGGTIEVDEHAAAWLIARGAAKLPEDRHQRTEDGGQRTEVLCGGAAPLQLGLCPTQNKKPRSGQRIRPLSFVLRPLPSDTPNPKPKRKE